MVNGKDLTFYSGFPDATIGSVQQDAEDFDKHVKFIEHNYSMIPKSFVEHMFSL